MFLMRQSVNKTSQVNFNYSLNFHTCKLENYAAGDEHVI